MCVRVVCVVRVCGACVWCVCVRRETVDSLASSELTVYATSQNYDRNQLSLTPRPLPLTWVRGYCNPTCIWARQSLARWLARWCFSHRAMHSITWGRAKAGRPSSAYRSARRANSLDETRDKILVFYLTKWYHDNIM